MEMSATSDKPSDKATASDKAATIETRGTHEPREGAKKIPVIDKKYQTMKSEDLIRCFNDAAEETFRKNDFDINAYLSKWTGNASVLFGVISLLLRYIKL